LQLYVINLDRSPDRLKHITQVFNALNLDFTRISAVDGKNLSEAELANVTQIRKWPKPLTRGEVGCLLSHRECLRQGVEQGAPFFAIFEDDIMLSPQASRLLRDDGWIAAGTDIVKLDTVGKLCLLEPLQQTPIAPYALGRLISKHYCTGGYIVSRETAIQLLDLTEQAFAPIDEIYFNPECGFLLEANVQQLVPAIVMQAGLTSTIRPAPALEADQKRRQRSRRPLWQRLKSEGQRYRRRYLCPFRLKWLKGYYWGKIPFN